MTIQDGIVRLTGDPGRAAGVAVSFDGRQRVQVPFGLRTLVGFHPGVRVLVLTVPAERFVAVLPVDRVVAALETAR